MLKKIGIIFGGNSTEHDASIHSYLNVLDSFFAEKKIGLIKKVIYIKGGSFFSFYDRFPKKEVDLQKGKSFPLNGLAEEMDNDLYWFSLLHGNEGEDGAYQGVAEIFGIKGSFGNLLPAAISMSKWVMSALAEAITKNEINSIPYIRLGKRSSKKDVIDFINNNPSEYYVVKPNRLGASLFTKKIRPDEARQFFGSKECGNILKYDKDILLQKYIKGREFTLGIMQKGDVLVDLPIVEIFTKDNFLGHKEKHKRGFVKVTFGQVEKNIQDRMVKNSMLLFDKLDFTNFCRFDYILSKNKIYLLEANSIPGLMSCSIFTRMLEEGGFTIPEMVSIFLKNNGQVGIKKDYRYEIE